MEDTVTTNVIKRNGEEVHFDRAKIVNAITKANGNVERIHQMNPYQIEAIADTIAEQVQEMPHAVNVEDIQDMVETSIMEMRGYEVAQKYVRYRYRPGKSHDKQAVYVLRVLPLRDHLDDPLNQHRGLAASGRCRHQEAFLPPLNYLLLFPGPIYCHFSPFPFS